MHAISGVTVSPADARFRPGVEKAHALLHDGPDYGPSSTLMLVGPGFAPHAPTTM